MATPTFLPRVNKDPGARRVPVDRKARREWMVIREILEQMEFQAGGSVKDSYIK